MPPTLRGTGNNDSAHEAVREELCYAVERGFDEEVVRETTTHPKAPTMQPHALDDDNNTTTGQQAVAIAPFSQRTPSATTRQYG